MNKNNQNNKEEKCVCGSVQFSYGGKCLSCGKIKHKPSKLSKININNMKKDNKDEKYWGTDSPKCYNPKCPCHKVSSTTEEKVEVKTYIDRETGKITKVTHNGIKVPFEQEGAYVKLFFSPTESEGVETVKLNVKALKEVYFDVDVIPSGRIDYCVDCDKEHGYDCPTDLESEWVEIYKKGLKELLKFSKTEYCPGCGITLEGLESILQDQRNKLIERGVQLLEIKKMEAQMHPMQIYDNEKVHQLDNYNAGYSKGVKDAIDSLALLKEPLQD